MTTTTKKTRFLNHREARSLGVCAGPVVEGSLVDMEIKRRKAWKAERRKAARILARAFAGFASAVSK